MNNLRGDFTVKYRKMWIKSLIFLFVCINLFASPCKDKQQAVWAAVTAVQSTEKTYKDARSTAIFYGAALGAQGVGDGIEDATMRSNKGRTGKGRIPESEGVKAVRKMNESKKAWDDAKQSLADARTALQSCIDSHKCPECDQLYKKYVHYQASCETCDATGFYSCKHSCPGIPTCSRVGCSAQLKTDSDKANHSKVRCSECKIPYYLCDSYEVDMHMPRICVRGIYVGTYISGNQLYPGKLVGLCGNSYRNCTKWKLVCKSTGFKGDCN